jgi:hypothetical protein
MLSKEFGKPGPAEVLLVESYKHQGKLYTFRSIANLRFPWKAKNLLGI